MLSCKLLLLVVVAAAAAAAAAGAAVSMASSAWRAVAPPPLMRGVALPAWLKRRVTFYRLHMLCFVIVILAFTLVFCVAPSGPAGKISFIDALFNVTSCVCLAGLITVDVGVFTDGTNVARLLLMFMGSQVVTSLVPVLVRRYYFHRYLARAGLLQTQPSASNYDLKASHTAASASQAAQHGAGGEGGDGGGGEGGDGGGGNMSGNNGAWIEGQRLRLALEALRSQQQQQPQQEEQEAAATRRSSLDLFTSRLPRATSLNQSALRAHSLPHAPALLPFLGGLEHRARQRRSGRLSRESSVTGTSLEGDLEFADIADADADGYGFADGYADAMVDEWLTAAQPSELRFLELRALETLSWLVPAFLATSLLTAFLLLLLIVSISASAKANLQANSVNSVFFCAFHAMSTFSNTGAALLNDNLMGFVRAPALIIVTSLFILIGNTMYPPTLRALLLLLRRFSRGDKRFVYSYLLVHPRKCYTHLFPPRSTMMLVLTVLAFNLTEFVFFCATDWTSPALDGFASGTKVLAGYFQSVSTRNAGFNVIAIGLLRPPMLLLYLGMMYVAVYPLYLTRQTSREQREVYDDEDIGVFWEDLQGGVLDHGVFTQGRGLLLRDSALLFIALLVICLIESANITNDISNFNIFNIAFELISGYGNVGLSLGYTCPPEAGPDCVSPPYSFSGVWNPWSKLVLVLVMLLGRHRGLPDNIDAAISIPNRNQGLPENIDAAISIPNLNQFIPASPAVF
ncbi:unnamed protein product [Closterium sp. Yama58-4]|nr:unnamed protein product [Closterium sp. Yama58-4]